MIDQSNRAGKCFDYWKKAKYATNQSSLSMWPAPRCVCKKSCFAWKESRFLSKKETKHKHGSSRQFVFCLFATYIDTSLFSLRACFSPPFPPSPIETFFAFAYFINYPHYLLHYCITSLSLLLSLECCVPCAECSQSNHAVSFPSCLRTRKICVGMTS